MSAESICRKVSRMRRTSSSAVSSCASATLMNHTDSPVAALPNGGAGQPAGRARSTSPATGRQCDSTVKTESVGTITASYAKFSILP
ncbi:hypothetical protein [Gordonia paraffinivorans]|uniref:hypothetical protein n=1 Tax=Gordonia paraffinivorans TaxID=175628 RepID=UPI0020D1483B|nr:hypothetical protein [Gordonia paraffinivorans]